MTKKITKPRILAITKASPKKSQEAKNPDIIAIMCEGIIQSQIAIHDNVKNKTKKITKEINPNIKTYIDYIKFSRDVPGFNIKNAFELAETIWGEDTLTYIKYTLDGILYTNYSNFLVTGAIVFDKLNPKVNCEIIMNRTYHSDTKLDRIYVAYVDVNDNMFVNNSDYVSYYDTDTISIIPMLKPEHIRELINKLSPIEISHMYTCLQIIKSKEGYP
jgi:hypothetical protein